MIVVVSIENTFAQGPDLKTAAAYRASRPFYEALKGAYQLVGLSTATEDIARWWLKREHMGEWAMLRLWTPDSPFSYLEWKVQEVREFLSAGWEVAFYIDSDWSPLMAVTRLGVSTLRVEHAHNVPGWRDPETTAPRPWSEVAATVEAIHAEGD